MQMNADEIDCFESIELSVMPQNQAQIVGIESHTKDQLDLKQSLSSNNLH